MYFKIIATLFLLFVLPGMVYSQTVEQDLSKSGSIYSGFGIGAPATNNSSYTNGMGLSGVSQYNAFAPSFSNPAQWGRAEVTQAQVTMGLTNYNSSDNLSSAEYSQFTFENFQFVFPLLRNQLGASISFAPVTRSDFSRIERGTLSSAKFGNTVEYASSILGTGGVNRFELGLGYQFNRNFSVGYAASAYLATLNREVTTFFSDPSFQPGNLPSSVNEQITGSTMGNRFGVFTQFYSPFRENDRLSISAAVNLAANMSTDRSVETFRSVEGVSERTELNQSSESRDGNINLPLEFNSGLTYYLNPYHSFSAEYLFQNWNQAEFSYNPTEEGYYTDRSKVGVGYQYQPFINQQSSGFFSNFRYSLGATYDNGFLAISDEDIETIMFHAGLTIPSQRSRSSIDISINYGTRGTESNSLVKENIWGIKLSLNLAELMFLQQRFQ